MPALAQRLNNFQVAASVAMTTKARELSAQGHAVISLTIGEPDFATPRHAVNAAYEAGLAGQTKYPPMDGTKSLKEAIQRKFLRDNNLHYALNEIMVANGGKQVITNAFFATCDPGDEVLIPSPFWISYAQQAKLAEATPRFIECSQNNGFRLRPEELEAAITPRTKWLILNFPNNPTGAACSREEMQALAGVLLRHPQVWIMSDDMYEHLVYDDFEFCTIAEVEPRLRDRVLTLNGASKTYAMTGWRIGYAGGPAALIRAMSNIQGQLTGGVSTVGQAAAAAALDGPQDLIQERAKAYRERRDLALSILADAPGMHCHKPEGAFYLYPNVAGCLGRVSGGGRLIQTDADLAMAILEEKYVGTVAGSAYGVSPYLRLSYATDAVALSEACGRIVDFCKDLR